MNFIGSQDFDKILKLFIGRQQLNTSLTEKRFRSKSGLLEGVSTKCVGFSGSSMQLASSFERLNLDTIITGYYIGHY